MIYFSLRVCFFMLPSMHYFYSGLPKLALTSSLAHASTDIKFHNTELLLFLLFFSRLSKFLRALILPSQKHTYVFENRIYFIELI